MPTHSLAQLDAEIAELDTALARLGDNTSASATLRARRDELRVQRAAVVAGVTMKAEARDGATVANNRQVVPASPGPVTMSISATGKGSVASGNTQIVGTVSGPQIGTLNATTANIATTQTVHTSAAASPPEARTAASLAAPGQLPPAAPPAPMTLADRDAARVSDPSTPATPRAARPVSTAPAAAGDAAAPRESIALLLDAELRGYRARLLDGSTVIDASLALTVHDLTNLVAESHAALRRVVDRLDANRYVFQQPDLTIDDVSAAWALHALAQTGARLWNALFAGPGSSATARAFGAHLRDRSRRGPLDITVIADHAPFPWALLYDGDPQAVTVDGFWGMRHILRAVRPGAGERASPPRVAGTPLPALVGLNAAIDRLATVQTTPVIPGQRAMLAALDMDITDVGDEAALLATLAAGSDVALIYLFCHMHSEPPAQSASAGRPTGSGATRIVLTDGGALTLAELSVRAPLAGATLLRGGPLILLNACGSADLSPLSYDGLVPYLLDQGARTVIGTECDTPIFFGATFGAALLRRVVSDGQPVGEALRDARRAVWETHHNPLGLLYALYGDASLRLI